MRSRMLASMAGLCALSLVSAQALAAAPPQKTLTLGFDGLADLALSVDSLGVTFAGAQVLACGGSLNCGPFPPASGKNVIYDQPGNGGVITATFDYATTGKVDKVSARITGNRNITMTAFDAQGQALASASTGGANYVGANTGIPPNKLLEVSSTAPIASVRFADSGNTFTVDDFTFTSAARSVVLDPGHGQIVQNGVPTYQRDATPTFGLYEDNLSLDMAGYARSKLEQMGIVVLLTRQGVKAPFAPDNCAVPCFIDLNKRARWAEKQEPDLMVSIHTNAGPPTAHGSESYYSSIAPAPDSQDLAGQVLSRVVGLGLTNRGVKKTNFNVINTNMASTLVEVAFHSNSALAQGQTITDEQRLNDPAFRAAAGTAIANGIGDYYAAP